jgi:alanine dehydrogenase
LLAGGVTGLLAGGVTVLFAGGVTLGAGVGAGGAGFGAGRFVLDVSAGLLQYSELTVTSVNTRSSYASTIFHPSVLGPYGA